MVRLDPPFTATRARVLNTNAALLQSTSPPARVKHQAARTKVSPTRGKVASKISAPNNNNKALQAAPRNNYSHLPLRLRHASHLWSFASRMTQRIITKGLTWRWSENPPKLYLPSHSTCRGVLAPHIKDMLQKGIILKVPLQPCFASPLFLVPKSSGRQRVIIDLSPLNKHILCPTFRMQDATKLRSCIPRHCFFTSIDLSEAFHHIPIHPRFQNFLSFFHDNNLYFFQAMPFGINLGPRIFTKVITEVLKLLHLQNIHASVYIDDYLLWNTSASTLARQTKTATTLLTNLGLSVNWEKSSLTPLQQITYLVVRWCRESHSLLPSRPNINKSLSLISLICQSSTISKKLHQRLLGTLNFLAPYLAQGKLRLRLIILHAPPFKKKLRVPIPPQWRNHLLWWLDEKNLSQPAPISLPPPTVTFWTDASRSGWGGSLLPRSLRLGMLDT